MHFQPDGARQTGLPGERQYLFDVAFRLLGSTADSESVVDRCYARWSLLTETDRSRIPVRLTWLTREVSRLSLDLLDAADGPRRLYLGEWLPEPVPHRVPAKAGSGTDDARDRVTLDESLNMLLLVTLESLAPAERVAFILHDVFGVPYGTIGDVVGRTPQASKDLARQARGRIQHRRDGAMSSERHDAIVLALLRATRAGDEQQVAALLAPDVTALIDGGGHVDAPADPVHGSAETARLLIRLLGGAPDLVAIPQPVNGYSGLVFRRGDRVVGVLSLNAASDRVRDIWIVVNPEKLRQWNAGRS